MVGYFSMQVFLLWYWTIINMLYNKTVWITKQLEHVLEKGSVYTKTCIREITME